MSLAKNRIRLFLFIDTFEMGGTERFTLRLAERLDRERFETVMGSYRDSGPLRHELAEDISLLHFHAPQFKAGWFPWILRMARFLRRERFDIVYTNHYQPNAVVGLAARLAGIPLVIGLRGLFPCDSFSKKFVYGFSNVIAHRVIANSRAVIDRQKDEGIVSKANTHIVHNGLPGFDVASFMAKRKDTRNRLGIDHNRKLIACVSRLSAEKGVDVLIKAQASIASDLHATTVIAGDGPQSKALKTLAGYLTAEPCIHFAGTLSDVRPLLAAADIFVLPSLSESFPNALIEAMQFGLPCIASDVGGVGEVLANEQNGLLVAPSDSVALAQAITKLARDDKMAKRLGEEARKTVEEGYNISRMVTAIENILIDTVETQGKKR